MGQDVGSKTSRITETSESNRSPAALGESLGQGRTLGCIPLQWKCPVHGCSRKMGHPSLCSGDSRYPTVPEVLSFTNTSFFFWCQKYPFGCAGRVFFLTCSTFSGSGQFTAVPPPLPRSLPRHSTPQQALFAFCSPPPVFLFYLEPLFWLSCPRVGAG